MDNQEQFTRLWTEAEPNLAGYINAVVSDSQEAEDLLQNAAVILLLRSPAHFAACLFLRLLPITGRIRHRAFTAGDRSALNAARYRGDGVVWTTP